MMLEITREEWMAKVPLARAIGWLILALGAANALSVISAIVALREIGSVPGALALILIGSTVLAVTQTQPRNDQQTKQRLIILGTVIPVVILMFPFGLA